MDLVRIGRSLSALWTTKVRIIVMIGIAAVSYLWIERIKTRAFEEGAKAGQERLFNERLLELSRRSAALNVELAQRETRLEATAAEQAAERQRLDRLSRSVTTTLNQQLESIRNQATENRNAVFNLSAPDLVPRIHFSLDELDAVDREQSGQPDPQ